MADMTMHMRMSKLLLGTMKSVKRILTEPSDSEQTPTDRAVQVIDSAMIAARILQEEAIALVEADLEEVLSRLTPAERIVNAGIEEQYRQMFARAREQLES